MAESRLDKYKEYRQSILASEKVIEKTTIDTTLKSTSGEINQVDLSNEIILANKLKAKKITITCLYAAVIIALLIVLIIYGVKLF